MLQTVKEGLKSNQGNAVLYAGLLGLFLSDVIPTPADFFVFKIEKKLRDRWKRGEISPQEYWEKKALAYYLLNPVWWAIVAGVTISIKGDANKKLKIVGALIGSGAVLAIIYKNIQKDKQELEEESLHIKELLESHPEYGQFLKDTQPSQFKNMSATT
jgi:hypothetical protein